MKKVTKVKKNWFKVQFEKHPYLFTFLIGWPILFYIIVEFIDPIVSNRFDDVLLIIFLLFPPIIFFLWFRKNKSKIKPFYKRKKKTFKKIYYSFGTIFALVGIYLIAVIISIGGITNFKDRVVFELDIWSHKLDNPVNNICEWAGSGYFPLGLGEFIKYEYKRWTQFFDYFEDEEITNITDADVKKANSFLPFYKGDPETQIKIARFYKNSTLNIYNPCKSTRYLLRAAHQGNKTAQEMIAVSLLPVGQYGQIEKVKDMNLKNPALAYTYAYLLDKKFKNPEALNYLKFSSDAGYLKAKEDLLDIYMDNFKTSNCKSIIEIYNHLAEQKSFIPFVYLLSANMGRIHTDTGKKIYQCLGNKPNFSKTFSMLEKHKNLMEREKSFVLRSFDPALFYLNGWGDVKQNHKKAYELFNNCDESRNCIAYLSYMNFKGLGVEKNSERSLDLAIKLIEETNITSDKEDSSASGAVIPCGGTQYDFILSDSDDEEKKSQYRKSIIACLNKADEEANIKSLENYIKTSMVNYFKNPELFETINYLGEAK